MLNFKERFKGKTQIITKDGLTGLINKESIPINKSPGPNASSPDPQSKLFSGIKDRNDGHF